jgi:23S rRNA (guanosine2251-2'-O)-methyltransferase
MKKQNFIYGPHAVEALLSKHPERVSEIFVQQEREDEKTNKILTLAEKNKIPVHILSTSSLQNLVGEGKHQGIVAKARMVQTYTEDFLLELLDSLTEPVFLLILDRVQDPHNLGACFRTADAAGVHAIIVPKDQAVGLTPVVCKVASGATETVPFIQVTNLVQTMKKLQERGVWLAGAAEEAETNLYDANLSGPIAVVMGAEGKGLRRLTKEYCDYLLHIPMAGSVSSLNVSVATGVFLFEVVRQRKK